MSKLWNLGATMVGLAVFVGLMWFFVKAHSHMWRLAAVRYAGSPRSPKLTSKIETAIVTTRGATGGLYAGNIRYRVYPGLSLAIHEDGLALSLLPPVNIMCPHLFLPFDEMDLERTSWALWQDPMAIRMKRLPDLDIILDRSTVTWVREHVVRTPFGRGA